MKRLSIAMAKILKNSLGIVRYLVISIVDCIFRKIIMTDSIKTAALILLLHLGTHLHKLVKVWYH
jgi:energy-converting hydrogenase Eha subunit G